MYNYNTLVGIKAVEFTASGDYLITSENPLMFSIQGTYTVCTSATLVSGDTISIAVPQSETYYVAAGDKFYATYYTSSTAISLDISGLNAGDEFNVLTSSSLLAKTFVAGDVLEFLVDASSEDRTFIATDGVAVYEFTVLAGQTSHQIDLTQFTSAVAIDKK